MKVQIIAHTPEPEKVIAAAAKLCYSSAADVDTLLDGLTPEKNEKFINHLMSLGHESPLEHVTFTFAVEGVSRVLTHELVRHRLASYSQRSMRFCAEGECDFYYPKNLTDEQAEVYNNAIEVAKDSYNKLLELGLSKQEARYVLPNATHTRIIFTMNIRSLINFCSLRACRRAQPEIQELTREMIKQLKEISPVLFKKLGPSCVYKGYCPEGDMSCGAAPTMEMLLMDHERVKNNAIL